MSTEDIDLSAVRIGKGNCAIHYWVSNSIALEVYGLPVCLKILCLTSQIFNLH